MNGRARRTIGGLLATVALAATTLGSAPAMAEPAPPAATAQVPTTLTLTADPASPAFGQAVDFTATVSPSAATGEVLFAIDGVPLGDPVALSGGSATSPSTSSLTPGAHEVTASYFGDAEHAASDATTQITVGLIPTTTTVANEPLGPTVGQTVTLSAVVDGVEPTGTVQFVLDGELLGGPIDLVDGQATSPASPPLTPGLHVTWAFYNGDSTHATSNSGAQSFNVTTESATIASLGSTPSPQVRLGTVAYTASIDPAITGGTIQFAVDGTTVGPPVAVVDGTATTPAAPVTAAAGSHTLTATYSGDATYSATSRSTTITVDKATPTLTPSSNWDQEYQPTFPSFDFQIGPGRGASGTLKIEVQGPGAPQPPDAPVQDGFAEVDLALPDSGTSYFVIITYSGDENFGPVTLNRQFTSEGDDATFVRAAYATVLDRPSDPAGLAHWRALLEAGATTPLGVVDALATSNEGRRVLVRSAYQDILGRTPDPAGLAYWQGRLAAGTSPEVLRSALLASNEGYRRAGGNPLGYSVKLYDHYLDRSAGSSELSFWTTRLGRAPSTWDRQRAALTIGRSSEGTRSAVHTALDAACASTDATEAQLRALAGRWVTTGRHPTRLAGAVLATVCPPGGLPD